MHPVNDIQKRDFIFQIYCYEDFIIFLFCFFPIISWKSSNLLRWSTNPTHFDLILYFSNRMNLLGPRKKGFLIPVWVILDMRDSGMDNHCYINNMVGRWLSFILESAKTPTQNLTRAYMTFSSIRERHKTECKSYFSNHYFKWN